MATCGPGASHFHRVVLGKTDGSDPNPNAELTGRNGEYLSNATDGEWDAGAAKLKTTGDVEGANVKGTFGSTLYPASVVVAKDTTAHAATNQTTDGTSVTVPAGALAAGKALRFKAGGTIAGGNAAKNVILYIDDAAIITLATQAATTGDWEAEFTILEHTDLANQKCSGKLIVATGADVEVDYATDTTNFAVAKTVKLQVVSGNASDTITQEWGIVEFLP